MTIKSIRTQKMKKEAWDNLLIRTQDTKSRATNLPIQFIRNHGVAFKHGARRSKYDVIFLHNLLRTTWSIFLRDRQCFSNSMRHAINR